MNTRSLSFRLVTWYAGVLTLVFILIGALTVVLLREYLESNVLDTQGRRARQIADTLGCRRATGRATPAWPAKSRRCMHPRLTSASSASPGGMVMLCMPRVRRADASFDPAAVPPPPPDASW